jgi:hypothetical protein
MSPSNAVTVCLGKTLGRRRKVPPYFFVLKKLFPRGEKKFLKFPQVVPITPVHVSLRAQ